MSQKSNLIISSTILLASIIIGGYFVLSSQASLADISTQITGWFKDANNQDPKAVDSDSDGLPDYLESIYGTNASNPDTDNDTYLDGEEIMSGYDPLKSAPDDKISNKAISPRPKPGSFAGVNLTDELGKAVLENIKNSEPDKTAAMGTGSAEDIETGLTPQAEIIIDNAIATALAKSPQLNFVTSISDSEIKILTDDSKKAQENYTNQIVDILAAKTRFPKLDVEAAQEAIQTKNYSGLDLYINGYLSAFKAIQEISVPPSWKELHKKNLSLILASANILQTIKSIDDDPLKSVLALQQYQQIVLPGLKKVYEDGLKLIQNAQQQEQPAQNTQ